MVLIRRALFIPTYHAVQSESLQSVSLLGEAKQKLGSADTPQVLRPAVGVWRWPKAAPSYGQCEHLVLSTNCFAHQLYCCRAALPANRDSAYPLIPHVKKNYVR